MLFSELNEFLSVVVEEQVNDQLWQVWLSNPLKEESFEDYKNKIIKKATTTKEDVKEEAEKAANAAEEMLKSFEL